MIISKFYCGIYFTLRRYTWRCFLWHRPFLFLCFSGCCHFGWLHPHFCTFSSFHLLFYYFVSIVLFIWMQINTVRITLMSANLIQRWASRVIKQDFLCFSDWKYVFINIQFRANSKIAQKCSDVSSWCW